MRGEHCTLPDKPTACPGSSPHARGAHPPKSRLGSSSGIIPACAGSTAMRKARGTSRWDHPRMRGEHARVSALRIFGAGSSPHARGALIGFTPTAAGNGIIPACAGSTRQGHPRDAREGDHPRMRGEHVEGKNNDFVPTGSSPHARGARHPPARPHERRGIIPACAGSTPRVPLHL